MGTCGGHEIISEPAAFSQPQCGTDQVTFLIVKGSVESSCYQWTN